MGGGLFLSILFARILGPEDFGKFNYILSFTSLFMPLFALGIGNLVLREFAKEPNNIPDIIYTCIASRFLSGLIVTIITCVGLYYFYNTSWKFQLLTILLISNIFNAFEVYERWFQHKSLNKYCVLWRISCFILFSLIKLYLILSYPNFTFLLVVVALEVIVKNSGYHFLYRKLNSQIRKGDFKKQKFLDIFSQSKYLIFSALAAVIYLKIDILMLEYMIGGESVGVYSVAAKLSEIWYVLPQILITAVSPKLIALAKNNKEYYLIILQKGFDYLFFLALCICVCVYFISPWFIDLLYGDNYSEASAIIRVHIFASLFIYMRALLSLWLVSEKYAEFSLFSQVSGAVSNIILNLILIPMYGAMGAAVATLISYSVTSYFCLFIFKRTRRIGIMMTKSIFIINIIFQTLSRLKKST